MINIIAAVSKNNIIGQHGGLPWLLKKDLKHFRDLTLGGTIVMGWNTWESIGCKPLGGRFNIVLSRDIKPVPRSRFVKLYNNYKDVLKRKEDLWIIGGAHIYGLFLPYTDKLYITRVFKNIYGDNIVRFPHVEPENWTLSSSSKDIKENDISFRFQEYVKIP